MLNNYYMKMLKHKSLLLLPCNKKFYKSNNEV